jgi:hypothetical protein
VSGGPRFDELFGTEPAGPERERLLRTHELLVQAGPPPELAPTLERAPTPAAARALHRRRVKRRVVLLLAAAIAAGAMFAAGYAVADHRGTGGSSSSASTRTLALKGTSAAPHARATLEILPAQAGNWPMTLSVAGLPKLPPHTYYEVYLVRSGRTWASCGSFVVARSSRALTVTLNAPYALRPGDSWIVTRTGPQETGPGKAVLRPA